MWHFQIMMRQIVNIIKIKYKASNLESTATTEVRYPSSSLAFAISSSVTLPLMMTTGDALLGFTVGADNVSNHFFFYIWFQTYLYFSSWSYKENTMAN